MQLKNQTLKAIYSGASITSGSAIAQANRSFLPLRSLSSILCTLPFLGQFSAVAQSTPNNPAAQTVAPATTAGQAAGTSYSDQFNSGTQDIETNTPPEVANPPSSVPFFGNAQSQPSSAAGYSGIPPVAPLAGTSQLSVAPPLMASGPISGKGLAHVGQLYLYPHIAYELSYGNGLQASPGQRSDSLINQFSPGVLLRWGDHWSLDYTPTLRFYSSSKLQDGVDQVVNLVGTATYEDWRFLFSQGYSATSQPLVETASQLSEEVYPTALRATHPLGSSLSLDLGLYQNFRYIDQGQVVGFTPTSETREWSTMDWVSYKFAPNLSAGIGAGFTYDNVSNSSDMTSEQLQGRVSWAPLSKITLTISGGADYRQFLSGGIPDLLSPIFAASAEYHLFEPTTLSLSASRTVTPSFYQDAISEAASVTAALHQRLLRRLSLDVSGGYSSTVYHQTKPGPVSATQNNYDVTSINVRLGTSFFKRASASVFFQENFISSNQGSLHSSLFNYNTRQYGLALGYRW